MLNDLRTQQFTSIFIACGYTDLRFGIDGLAALVQNEFELDPFQKGTLFLFCGRNSRKRRLRKNAGGVKNLGYGLFTVYAPSTT